MIAIFEGQQYKRDFALEPFLVRLRAQLQILNELRLEIHVLLRHSPRRFLCIGSRV